MARGCLCCVKYMLFLFNLLFWLGGCGLLGVGVWLSVSQGSFATLSPSFPSISAANLIITLGAVIMVTGFLGCLGAIKENKCLLLSVSENARQDLKEGLALYSTNNNAGLRNAWNTIQTEVRYLTTNDLPYNSWNTIQTEWHCCGVNGYTDWHTALQEKVVPDHCCQNIYQDCGRNATNQFWTRGCYEKVEEWLDDNKHLLGTIAMCVLVIQLLGMAFSMTLYQQIHRSGKKYEA
ncbi:tetraspanin-9 isoform X3 [Salvelinus namaycush]|uniref:Tetraspanin n=1 Tax=Salvelinus namaycush TaxID=8040 RepID=A0A8U0TZ51_SALNM|nr:tetraspanin-9 isoform X3 [Salvelinus namaycush]